MCVCILVGKCKCRSPGKLRFRHKSILEVTTSGTTVCAIVVRNIHHDAQLFELLYDR